ncbi:STAS domain-containing protein [Marinobacter sp. F4206]|uniref:STAS domain-containing protein n=1 Tax=Marinobacter sp. F4206 TaxID=2861777 RepID=UPI001C5F705E|nr:STAS domain-containing protein [Marinobacter sp. F4206]MBW4933837.1 STAS domain-containing protein [Marinobacter sp. F4206]
MTALAPRVDIIDSALTVSGDVDAGTVMALRQQGEKLINTVNADLIVDLGSLRTAHSVVLSLLLCWQRLANRRGLSLSYRGVSERLASLAALSNLDDQLSGFSSVST